MGFWFIPIRVPTAKVHIQADRRLAFQVLTAWKAARLDVMPTSRMLEREGDRLLIQFHTDVKMPFGIRTVQRTVEWVTAAEPGRTKFEGVKGPLPVLLCRWNLEEWGNCCRFTYDSTFALHGSLPKWLFGALLVRPLMPRIMREHLAELKESIEPRAAWSRLFPQRPCPPDESTGVGAHTA